MRSRVRDIFNPDYGLPVRRQKRAMFATLDSEHNVVETDDILEFGQFFEQTEKRIVAKTQISGLLVSTVFLGINHGFGWTVRPLWFETMIFGDDDRTIPPDAEQLLSRWREAQEWRYATWDEALSGHASAVTMIREGLL